MSGKHALNSPDGSFETSTLVMSMVRKGSLVILRGPCVCEIQFRWSSPRIWPSFHVRCRVVHSVRTCHSMLVIHRKIRFRLGPATPACQQLQGPRAHESSCSSWSVFRARSLSQTDLRDTDGMEPRQGRLLLKETKFTAAVDPLSANSRYLHRA